jgi:hypothetical protein
MKTISCKLQMPSGKRYIVEYLMAEVFEFNTAKTHLRMSPTTEWCEIVK